MSEIRLTELTAAGVLPLRQELLRPGAALSDCVFEGDRADHSFHLGIVQKEKLVGIASFLHQSHPDFPDKSTYRLRGMAIQEPLQHKGLGRKLLNGGLQELTNKGVDLLWFNARQEAVGFYRKQGFSLRGDKFTIPDVGPHYLMIGFLK